MLFNKDNYVFFVTYAGNHICQVECRSSKIGVIGDVMNEKKHKVTVEIFGETYCLKSDAKLEKVVAIASEVDSRMKSIAQKNLRLSPGKVAVLAALNIAEAYLDLEQNYKQLIKMVEEEK
ncbi:cell division protein ZapA [Pelosinus propionicus]|nr:cell division protein ZapA [Pelosinus propionicus]